MVAVVGALLFLRSFRNASRIEPGFDTRNVVVSQFYLSNAGYSAQEQWAFCRTLRERMEAVPGVVGVTYSDFVPLTSPASSPEDHLEVDGYVPAPNERMRLPRATVPPGFFQFMGIPLLEGREFTERDEAGAPAVLIVNETFARRFFGGKSPIGRTVAGGGAGTIVGLVKDSKYDTPTEGRKPYFYRPFRQQFAPGLNFAFLVKTTGDPMLVRAGAAPPGAGAQPGRRLPLRAAPRCDRLLPLRAHGHGASLLTVVGAVCLLLAAAGLYSVISYAVSQRVAGVRGPDGARRQPHGPRADGGCAKACGSPRRALLVGMAVALAAARGVGGMLVGVGAADPATFAGAALFLLVVTLLASYWPARRAARVDPMSAVRSQ